VELGLNGKVVIVTGGSDGLGAATAATLAGEGARVAICARNEERLRATAERIGGEVLPVRADVTRPEDLEHLVEETVGRWGHLDAIVNNAGLRSAGPFESLDDETWRSDLDLKLFAAIRLSRLAVPHLRAAGGGAIVNNLATAGKAPAAGSMPTSVSRAAGLALSKALSKELGQDRIRVNGVLIGFVESDQWRRNAQSSGKSLEEVLSGLAANIPLGRVGKAEELGALVAFLVSDRAQFISGCGINFDGGMSPIW
jgi:NAD(P)-dependent dehydrogenase (short-subunit alcohol dehydrogenase family)